MTGTATVFVPGSIGNVGPGFDVLGLAVGGIGDTVTVRLSDGPSRIEKITGRDAGAVPRDPLKNVAAIAASAALRRAGIDRQPVVTIEKGLALSGGMGGSAASSVGGALAAALAAGLRPSPVEIALAALEGEATAAGRHLDNIAPSILGGLALVRSVDPVEMIRIDSPPGWSIALLTPAIRLRTREARAILPERWERTSWVQQMANTTALAIAFATGNGSLVRTALDDLYAEPLRAPLIPRFDEVKRAALEAGALGCSISGAGPTIFAIVDGDAAACAAAMQRAIGDVASTIHVGPIAQEGARQV